MVVVPTLDKQPPNVRERCADFLLVVGWRDSRWKRELVNNGMDCFAREKRKEKKRKGKEDFHQLADWQTNQFKRDLDLSYRNKKAQYKQFIHTLNSETSTQARKNACPAHPAKRKLTRATDIPASAQGTQDRGRCAWTA